jgi:hypothetical protein
VTAQHGERLMGAPFSTFIHRKHSPDGAFHHHRARRAGSEDRQPPNALGLEFEIFERLAAA